MSNSIRHQCSCHEVTDETLWQILRETKQNWKRVLAGFELLREDDLTVYIQLFRFARCLRIAVYPQNTPNPKDNELTIEDWKLTDSVPEAIELTIEIHKEKVAKLAA